MKKRIISVFLTICFLILSLPLQSLAAGVTCYYGTSCAQHAAEVNGKHYDTLDDAIKAAQDGDTINLLKENDETVPVTIRDKSITIKGHGHSTACAYISNTFIIKHTSGGHTVTFDNIYWYLDSNSAIQDISVCKDASDVNVLNVTNCLMYVQAENKDQLPVVGIFGTKDAKNGTCVSGTKLVMSNNTIQTMHYTKDEESDTYFNGYAMGCAVALNCSYTSSYKFDMDGDVYHYAKHTISKNNFRGYFQKAIIGGYVDITDNTIRMSYYSSYSGKNMGEDCIKVSGASCSNMGGQLNVTISGNKFYNFDGYVLTVANIDGEVASSLKSQVLMTGNVGITKGGVYYKPNSFSEIGKLVQYEKTGTAYSIILSPDLMTKDWNGIKDSNVSIYIGNIPFTKSGVVTSDYMLTESGILSKTYTQLPSTEESRTGFYYDYKGSGVIVRLWYLCTYGQNCHLLTDKNNNIFAAYVEASGESETFKDYRSTLVPTNLARAEVSKTEASDYEAKLYSLGYKATVLDGNTYRNAIVTKLDNSTYTISADEERDLTEKDIIVYLSDNGGNKVTYLTYDENESIPSNGVRVVVPSNEMTKVSYAGDKAINVLVDIKELEIDSACQVNVSALSNIETLNVNSKATINNNGYITNINVGHNDTATNKRDDIQENASGAIIQNNKNIENIVLNTRAIVNNGQKNYNVINKQATVNSLVVGNPNATLFNNENTTFYANGSIVNNYGTIEGDKLDIYTATTFNNYGTVDDEKITIGYLGKNDDHSGTEFNNFNVVNADFTLYGSSIDKVFPDTVTQRPYIYGLNVGTMTGSYEISKATYPPYHGFLDSKSSDAISIFSASTQFSYPEYVNANNNEFDISTSDGITGWTISSDNKDIIFEENATGYHVSNLPTDACTIKFTTRVSTIDTEATFDVLVRATPEYETPTGLSAEYNTMLFDVELPEGFSWQGENDLVGEIGEHTFYVIYTPDDLGTYHAISDIPVLLNVVLGTPEYTIPEIPQQEYGTLLNDIELPEGFSWQYDENATVGDEGENTLLVYFTPEDTTRFKVIEDIELNINVTHHYNQRTNECDFCGRANPDAKFKQINKKLKSKTYERIATNETLALFPTYDELENTLQNAVKSKNDFANPSKSYIYSVGMTYKSNGEKKEVNKDNFPIEALTCQFNYDDLKVNNTYNFTIARILSDGTIDFPIVTKTKEGITFDVDSFGAIIIGAYADENTIIESDRNISVFAILVLFIFLLAIIFVVLYIKMPIFKMQIDNLSEKANIKDNESIKKLSKKIDIVKNFKIRK